MDVVTLTKKLVAIPSFVADGVDETQLADFICAYITENLPGFEIYKQKVIGTRYNIVAYNSKSPKLMFCSHMDTVLANGKLIQRLNPIIKDGKLYGLGAVDMKGGLASALLATKQVFNEASAKQAPMALLFTCDEEYYFAGINKFIEEFQAGALPFAKKSKPELVVCPEPSDLKIANGCRGCVEIEFTVTGKSAHAGRPNAGINAIEQAVSLVAILKDQLLINNTSELGYTTVNLAGITGGVEIDSVIKIRANAIPDCARVVLDIRTAAAEQTASFIFTKINNIAKTINVGIKFTTVKLDLPPFLLDKKDLGSIELAITSSGLVPQYREDIASSGIGEFSLLGAKLGFNAINFGPGPGQSSHKAEEFVNISDLEQVTKTYIELIKLFLKI